jgi:hypothetical protein
MPSKKVEKVREETSKNGRPQEWWTPERRAAHSKVTKIGRAKTGAGVVVEKAAELERLLSSVANERAL